MLTRVTSWTCQHPVGSCYSYATNVCSLHARILNCLLGRHAFVRSRLACFYILRCVPGDAICLFAIKCSSFSSMNLGTSKRSACNALGSDDVPSVRSSNQLLERLGFITVEESLLWAIYIYTVQIIILEGQSFSCTSRLAWAWRGWWSNPGVQCWKCTRPGVLCSCSSTGLVGNMPKLDQRNLFDVSMYICIHRWGAQGMSMLPKATRVCWWMSHYGSPTPKRQYMWSSSTCVGQLDKGKLHMVTSSDRKHDGPKSARYYRNKHGKKCWEGTRHLKKTEWLVPYISYNAVLQQWGLTCVSVF